MLTQLVVLLAMLVIISCTAQTPIQPHGEVPASKPNLPVSTGTLEVQESTVRYFDNAQGYFVRPNNANTYPGVIMMHEWWGLNDNIKAMARELASQGYLVLAVDLFGVVATTPDEARKLIAGYNQTIGIANMQAATQYLREQGAPKVGSLGWCFGGGQSLQIGMNEQLDATVIYYGQLVTDQEKLAPIKQPVLGIFAENDKGIPPSKVTEFGSALTTLGVSNNITIYPGVDHAFANPSGDRYNAIAAQDAWIKTTHFLEENLK